MSIGRKISWIGLIVAAAGIKILALFPVVVERYYSRGFYPVVSRLQRFLFGWIPFSIGDILYLAIAVILLYRLVRLIRRLVRRQAGKGWFLLFLRQTVFVLLWVYVLFNVLWGLNYDRLGIADQLQLQVRPYSTDELSGLVGLIVEELNRSYPRDSLHRADFAHTRVLRAGAIHAYDNLARSDPRFAYRTPSVKSSFFSYPGLYIGFGGYYNPFSGEAQVNTDDPLIGQPFTTCHEMGHQLGYAKENEANFIGFLAATSSPDSVFSYSVYLDLYLFAARELYFRDSARAKKYRDLLAPGVREDFHALQRFNRRYANPLEPVIWKIYGRYLRANRQPHGIVTYSEVVAWLIAYAKKNGADSIRAGARVPRAPYG
jgi:Protein of unknown function (DUF3810)